MFRTSRGWIAWVALLAAAPLGSCGDKASAAEDSTRLQLDGIVEVFELHNERYRRLPSSLDELVAQGILGETALVDAWGRRLTMKRSGDDSAEICSSGPDQKPDNEDDLCVTYK